MHLVFSYQTVVFSQHSIHSLLLLVWSCGALLHCYFQFAVVEHYFVDGALHVCQTAGTCSAREWVKFGKKGFGQESFLLGASKIWLDLWNRVFTGTWTRPESDSVLVLHPEEFHHRLKPNYKKSKVLLFKIGVWLQGSLFIVRYNFDHQVHLWGVRPGPWMGWGLLGGNGPTTRILLAPRQHCRLSIWSHLALGWVLQILNLRRACLSTCPLTLTHSPLLWPVFVKSSNFFCATRKWSLKVLNTSSHPQLPNRSQILHLASGLTVNHWYSFRTQSWSLSSGSTSSRTSVWVRSRSEQIYLLTAQKNSTQWDVVQVVVNGRIARLWWRSTSLGCTPWPWRSSSSPLRSAIRSLLLKSSLCVKDFQLTLHELHLPIFHSSLHQVLLELISKL